MNDISFFNSFTLNVYSFRTYRYTDNSRGIRCHYLAKMTDGRARFVCESGEAMEVCAGDVFYLPIGLRYRSYWYGDADGRIGWISISLALMPTAPTDLRGMQKISATAEAHSAIDRIVAVGLPSAEGIGVLYTLIARLLPGMSTVASEPNSTLAEIRRYMRENPRIRIPDLARHCRMSESGLYAYVKRHTGMTPIAMHNSIKAATAAELLASTDMKIEDVASRLGFESTAYFRKIFKSTHGKTPSEIKRQRRLI